MSEEREPNDNSSQASILHNLMNRYTGSLSSVADRDFWRTITSSEFSANPHLGRVTVSEGNALQINFDLPSNQNAGI